MKETTNLKLKKPDQNDFYNIDDFNNNSDIIDEEIGKIKEDMKNISTDAEGTSYDNTSSGLTSQNVQGAVDEVLAIAKDAKSQSEANKTSILNLQNELGTNKSTLQNNINAIREVL
jgi:predicted  nucleic acid-binding Zn-ribbon protein|nr:MAG TPA: hypothetical protein [Caudoviricetes sp.]